MKRRVMFPAVLALLGLAPVLHTSTTRPASLANNAATSGTIVEIAGGGARPADPRFFGTEALFVEADGDVLAAYDNGISALVGDMFVSDDRYADVPFTSDDWEFGPDGTFYTPVFGPVFMVPAGGQPVKIAGGGVAAPIDGSTATEVRLTPTALSVAPNGDLYVVDRSSGLAIRRVSKTTGQMTQVAGSGQIGVSGNGGSALAAAIDPEDIFVTATHLYLLEGEGSVVRKIDLSTGIITQLAGTYGSWGSSGDDGPANAATICGSDLIAAADGTVYIGGEYGYSSSYLASRCRPTIRRISTTGVISLVAGSATEGVPADGAVAKGAPFGWTHAMALDPQGRLVASVQHDPKVGSILYRITIGGALQRLAGRPAPELDGSPDGTAAVTAFLPLARSVAVNGSGLVAVDTGSLRTFVPGGALSTLGVDHGRLEGFSAGGSLYASAGTSVSAPVVIAPSGVVEATPPELSGFDEVMVSPAGEVFGGRYQLTGSELRKVGSGLAPIRSTNGFVGFDSIDNAGNVYSTTGSRIERWTTFGVSTAIAGTGALHPSGSPPDGEGGPALAADLTFPRLVTPDAAGNVYFEDAGYIRRIGTDGILHTVAGNGTVDYTGNGGPATAAGLGFVSDLAVGPDGSLYIAADVPILPVGSRGTVRRITFPVPAPPPPDPVPTTAPSAQALPNVLQPAPKPDRVLDTRLGIGAPNVPIGAGGVLELQVTGLAGVPADAVAVALNVTVVDAEADGFLAAWPCGAAFPTTSNLNYRAGQTVPNMVISKIGTGGRVCIYADGAADVLADVTAWFGPTSPYVPLVPERILETRPAAGQQGYAGPKPAPGQVLELQVTGVGAAQVPAGVAAVVLNVTGTDATADGYVTVWPCGEPMPNASNLNLVREETRPNLVISRVPASGKVCIFTEAGTHLLADLSGYFPAGSNFTSLTPERILETRSTAGQLGYAGDKPAGGQVVELQVVGVGAANLPVTAAAVVLNVTGTEATAQGYVTVWPCGQPRPNSSNLNLDLDATAPNLVIAKVGTGGKVCIFTEQGTHLLADLAGWFPT